MTAGIFFTNGVAPAAGPLVGTEKLPTDTAAGSESLTVSQIAEYVMGVLPFGSYAVDGATGSFVPPAALVAGAAEVVVALTGTLAADSTMTMPTATAMIAVIPGAFVGQSYVLRVLNDSGASHVWTVVGNASVTVAGSATIAQNSWREFLVTLGAGLLSVAMQNIGGGTVT